MSSLFSGARGWSGGSDVWASGCAEARGVACSPPDCPPCAAGPATDSQLPGLPLQGFSRSTAASPSKQPSQND